MQYYPNDNEYKNQRAVESIRKAKLDSKSLPIMSIFRTLEGEGVNIGKPRIFVRVGGCPVFCTGCDTPESFTLKTSNIMSLHSIIGEVRRLGEGRVREVTITGGEPMMYPQQIKELARDLADVHFKLNLETSGLILDTEVFAEFDFVSLDIKTPSSGVQPDEIHLMRILEVWRQMGSKITPKLIITNQEDLDWIASAVIHNSGYHSQSMTLNLTPAASYKFSLQELVENYKQILNMVEEWNRGYNIRVIPQIHKLLDFA